MLQDSRWFLSRIPTSQYDSKRHFGIACNIQKVRSTMISLQTHDARIDTGRPLALVKAKALKERHNKRRNRLRRRFAHASPNPTYMKTPFGPRPGRTHERKHSICCFLMNNARGTSNTAAQKYNLGKISSSPTGFHPPTHDAFPSQRTKSTNSAAPKYSYKLHNIPRARRDQLLTVSRQPPLPDAQTP